MATISVSPQRSSVLRPKYVVFAFIVAMMAYVLHHNESFLIHPQDPVWQHYQPFKWWLLPHGLAGACALLLGPMQFSDRLRQRFTKLHRVVGRIYVAGALVLAPLGAYIQYFEERLGATRSFSIAAGVDAVLLFTTTAIAFSFAVRGMITQHRQWMTRSFAVATVFLQVRVITGVTGWDTLPDPIAGRITETVVWTCVAFSLLVADVILYWQDFRRSRPKPAKSQAAIAGD